MLHADGVWCILGLPLIHAEMGRRVECHITAKEMVPIVVAAAIWGKIWRSKIIRAWCNNAAVANPEPTAILEALLDLLVITNPDWTSALDRAVEHYF